MQEQWNVYYGGFYEKSAKSEDPGWEYPVDKGFAWLGKNWRIPAVYACRRGLVADFIIEIPPEEILAFQEKWRDVLEDPDLQDEMWEQIELENPLSVNMTPHLSIDGCELVWEGSSAASFHPCLPDENSSMVLRLLRHYGCDKSSGWIFFRSCFGWASRPEKPSELYIRLEQEAQSAFGGSFTVLEEGETIALRHPVTGMSYRLCVTGYEAGELPDGVWDEERMKYPRRYMQFSYELPSLPHTMQIEIQDAGHGDAPISASAGLAYSGGISDESASAPYAKEPTDSTVIGSADGPTALFLGTPDNAQSDQEHIVVSSLYFRLPDRITWKAVFREKTKDDREIWIALGQDKRMSE